VVEAKIIFIHLYPLYPAGPKSGVHWGTDGPSYDLAATQAEAAKLKSIYGTKMIVIGIGSKVRIDELT